MKILVFSYYDNRSKDKYSFKEIGQLTLDSKVEYCKIHGYDFSNYNLHEGYPKEIGWFKIDIIRERLKDYDWILYCEADAMICNYTIRLEEILDINYNFIIAKNSISSDWNGINCGVFAVRNSEWSMNFLNKIHNKKEFWHHNQAEQQAIINEFEINTKEMLENCKIIKNKIFNSYFHEWYEQDNFKMGDFILHDAGAHNIHRFQLFNELKDKIIKEENSDLLNYKITTPLMI